jgi:anthranilate synthase/aminodeoxychorismate synthase-like glutamine amidotransferase
MILLIDNYDSFVFNLARYVAELGHEYLVVRNDEMTLAEVASLSPTHIILSPGPCSPNEAGICLALIRAFLDKIPILGVCLGHQAIAQACGGNVVRAKFPQHGKSSLINHDGKGLFLDLPNPFRVGRYHSLIVDNERFPGCFKITAQTSMHEIMAIEHRRHPVFGVQFHPESVLTEHGHAMIQRFLASTLHI